MHLLKPSEENASKVRYKFYATLLDAFQWYLDSDEDEAFPEFLRKVNRIPFTNEAIEKGTAFNELVDRIKNGELVPVVDQKGMIAYNGFEYRWNIVSQFVDHFLGAADQVYVEGLLPTPKGKVLLYGYIDEVAQGGNISDIKTTRSYDFPKYLRNWQHLVYPYCLHCQDITDGCFSYEITDFNHHYREDYVFDASRDTRRLISICTHLIDFLEAHKDKITDRKIFALD